MKHCLTLTYTAMMTVFFTVTLTAQEVALSPYRDFTYPQTPTFTDLTQPLYNPSSVDTVSSMNKRARMNDSGTRRERYGTARLIYVMPGGLEPKSEYKLALNQLLGVQYQPGTLSFSGPADALICITNFAWGTENNNGNFLPLLIRGDYQDIKTPTFDITWTIPPEYNINGSKVTPITNQITLNYTFKIPTQSKVDWGDDRKFNHFSAAGGIFGNAPAVTADQVFRWSSTGLETFRGTIKDAIQVNISANPPQGRHIEGIAVQPQNGMLFFAFTERQLNGYNSDGSVAWEVRARAPIILYRNRLIAFGEDYQSLLILDAVTGKKVGSAPLPDFLPQYENALAIIETNAGSFLLISIPNQSRLLSYRIGQ